MLFMLISIPDYGQISFFNRPPTIDEIPDYGPVPENSGQHRVRLTGISPGKNEFQVVTITAITDNANLISDIAIDYTQGDEADLVFNLVPDANGKANITVTLDDGQIFRSTTSESFEVKVYAVNGEPYFSLTSELIAVEENAGKIEIKSFAINIDDGDPELDQKLSFATEVESLTETLSFKSEPSIDKNGNLKFEVTPNTYGDALVSVILEDDGGTKFGGDDTSIQLTFTIRVREINEPPTIDPVDSPLFMVEDEGIKKVQLTGISSGIGEDQQITLSTAIDNPSLISLPIVEYELGSDQASLTFSTLQNQFGEVIITVKINDGQSQTSIQFTVIVQPVADTPNISNARTEAGIQTKSGLVINRNANDHAEVTHYKVTNIKNGVLYQSNGITRINNNQFITHAQGNAGLKFTPNTGISDNGTFAIQAATGASNAALGGGLVTAVIEIANEPPVILPLQDSEILVTEEFLYDVKTSDPNSGDQITISFVIPDEISPWFQTTDFGDGTGRLIGIPPEGSSGNYQIYIIAQDQFGAVDEQSFNLSIKELNKPPVLSTFTVEIKEDDTLIFDYEILLPWFLDPDGDSIQSFRLISEPLYGILSFNGNRLLKGDIVPVEKDNPITYLPNKNYFGLDILDWNVSDGQDFALIPQRVNIIISSVFDPPEIRNLEDYPIIFEYGDDQFKLTETGEIFDEDSEKLERVTFTISNNYDQKQDSLYYEKVEGLNFKWDEALGVLSVEGLAMIADYQQVLSSIIYVNRIPLSPTLGTRQIEIVLQDTDTISPGFSRQIIFGETYDNLNLGIPTGFTPNGDGVNDIWFIENIGRYPDFQVEVYSRSGKRLFNADSKALGWDGRSDGELVPSGVYYYFINFSNFDKVLKGTISVLR